MKTKKRILKAIRLHTAIAEDGDPGDCKFSDIKEALPDLPQTMLAHELCNLMRKGKVTTEVVFVSPAMTAEGTYPDTYDEVLYHVAD